MKPPKDKSTEAVRTISKKYLDTMSAVLGEEVEILSIVRYVKPRGDQTMAFLVTEMSDLERIMELASNGALTMASVLASHMRDGDDTVH